MPTDSIVHNQKNIDDKTMLTESQTTNDDEHQHVVKGVKTNRRNITTKAHMSTPATALANTMHTRDTLVGVYIPPL